jgi:hypothetical protein
MLHPRQFGSISSLIVVAAASVAHAQNLRVVAYSGMTPPGRSAPDVIQSITSVQIAPSGEVAFGMTGSGSGFTGGVAIERNGSLAMLVEHTTSQVYSLPIAIDADGNALVEMPVPNSDSPSRRQLRIIRSDGSVTDWAATGTILPQLPDRVIGNWTSGADFPSIPILFPEGVSFMRVPCNSLATPTTVSSVLLAHTDAAGQQPFAVRGASSPSVNLPVFVEMSSVLDANASGHAVFHARPSSQTTSGVYLWNGTDVTRLLGVGDVVPGETPPQTISSLVTSRINDTGQIMVTINTPNAGRRVLVRDAQGFTTVYRTGEFIVSPRQTMRLLDASTIRSELDDDGSVVIASQAQLTSPLTRSIALAVVRVKAGMPARVLWTSEEPVRSGDGSFVTFSGVVFPLFPQPNSPLHARPIFGIRRLDQSVAYCAITDYGDPVLLVAGNTVVQLPTGPRTLNASLLPNFTQFGNYSFASNAAGQIALSVSTNPPTFPTVSVALVASPPVLTCGDIDFNNDAVWPSDQDTINFFDVLAGAPCPTLRCDTIDFNRNGVVPEDQDVIDFFNVLAGGTCAG